MSKVRVYELAKEYGLKGPDLAKLLKEHGIDSVKSHMAVLDDATELHARAIVEAQGGSRESEPGSAAPGRPTKKALPISDASEKKQLPTPATGGDAGPRMTPRRVPPPERKELPGRRPMPAPTPATAPESGAARAPVSTAPPAPVVTAPTTKPPTAKPSIDSTPASPVRAERESTAPAATSAEPQGRTPTTAAARTPPGAPPVPTLSPDTPAAQHTVPASPAPAAATPPAGAADSRAEAPADQTPGVGAPSTDAAATDPAAPPVRIVKKLIAPQAKATVLGRMQLPAEVTRDAQKRSAPGGGRNPGAVSRDLRRAAQRNIQSRSATRTGTGGGRAAPGVRRGPGVGGRGRSNRRTGPSTSGALSSTVDPNKVIEIQPPITVKALSEAIGVKVQDLIAALTFKLGVIGKTINSFLTNDEIELVALETKRNIKLVEKKEAEEELLENLFEQAGDAESMTRAPVVTFMGHVDHGKTTLLDALRKSAVAKTEAGGITQHVGAYKIRRDDGRDFVVLDTPGHEAFTAMRARGAKITDIVVLVVAADDGVMPQTEEAIAHAKEAGGPIIVAINKCDRPNANPMQVKQQLAVKGLQPEDWGGDTQMVELSALTGQGLDDLVDAIALRGEISELRAMPDAAGEAVVIESKQTPEQGVTVNVLVTNGTLRLRDQVLCGESLSRIRGIIDDHGEQLAEAGPSTPVALLGLTSLPIPGDKLYVVNDKKKAREVVEERQRQTRTEQLAERSAMNQRNLMARLQQHDFEEIKIILKADVMGSLEPIKHSLAKLETDEVKVNVIYSALGGISETDVSLAQASGAMIIGFNAVADQSARMAADRAGVDIRFYDIIYELIEDVRLAMEGKLKPDEVEENIGYAEIRAVFRSSKFGNIAGCYVTEGVVRRNCRARLTRDGKVVISTTISSLRREKDDAKEVRAGFECGMTLKDYNDIKEGDVIEFFDVKLVKRTL